MGEVAETLDAEAPLTATLAQFADIDGVPSEVTLRKLIADNPDFPATPGRNGVKYVIDVRKGIEWLQSKEAERLAAERDHADAVKQLGLDLLGESAASNVEQAGLSAAERKTLLEEELVAIKVAERRGDLIRKDSIESALASVIVKDAQRRSSFAARLAKRIDLPRDLAAAIDGLQDHDRKVFADELGQLTENPDADAESGADPAV